MTRGQKVERALMLDRVGSRRLRPLLELAKVVEHTAAGPILVAVARRAK